MVAKIKMCFLSQHVQGVFTKQNSGTGTAACAACPLNSWSFTGAMTGNVNNPGDCSSELLNLLKTKSKLNLASC